MTLKIARAIIILLVIMLPSSILANSNVVKIKNTKVKKQIHVKKYPKDVIDLAARLERDKKKYGLKYKNEKDLLDTLNKIWIHTRHDKNFNFYKVASIAIVESKLDHKAYNKRDGGKGLTQTMPKYWKEELPWYNNPYDKNQSIKASVAVLNKNKEMYKCSNWEAVRRYNGNSRSTYSYVAKVKQIYNAIRKDV